MRGQLFTEYYLSDGIQVTPEWRAQQEAFAAFRDEARQRFRDFSGSHNPNEAVTEQDLIRPLLELLGWSDYLPQQGAAARRHGPPGHALDGGTHTDRLIPLDREHGYSGVFSWNPGRRRHRVSDQRLFCAPTTPAGPRLFVLTHSSH